MTIEVSVRPVDIDMEQQLQPIKPGQVATFTDLSDGTRRVVAAICYPDNSGGEVYSFDNQDFEETPEIRLTPLSSFTPANHEAYIPAGGTYERSIVSKSRFQARIILRHIVSEPS